MTMISKKIQNKSLLAAVVAAAPLLSNAAFSSEDDSSKIEEIFVSASRIEQSMGDVIGPVSKVTAVEIQEISPYDISDVLAMQPGVNILRNGSRGSDATVQIRGATSSQTLALVNGQRYASATLGTARFNLIPPELVSGVEIVRGSSSAVYGSDAIGGVVNTIIGPRHGEANQLRFSLEYGSHNYYRDAVAGNREIGQVQLSGALVRERSDGINSKNAELEVGDATNILDDDGYERDGGAFHFSYQPDEDSRVTFLSLLNKDESDYDATSPASEPYSKGELRINQLTAKRKVDEVYSLELMVGHAKDHNENLERNPEVTAYDSELVTENTSIHWINRLNFEWVEVVFGYDQHKAKLPDSNYVDSGGLAIAGNEAESGFLQLNGGFGAFAYSIGARHDDAKARGDHDTQSLALSYELTDAQKVYARYVEGYRAPTLNDLYSPWGGGNANLRSEFSENYELGYGANLGDFSVALDLYRRDVADLIEWQPSDPSDQFAPWHVINVGRATFTGGEFSIGYHHDAFGEFLIGYDYLDAVEKPSAESQSHLDVNERISEKDMLYRAKDTLRFQWRGVFGPASVGVVARAQSRRDEPSEDIVNDEGEVLDSMSVYNPGYGTVDVTTAYQVSPNVSVDLKVNNIFDKSYSLKSAYYEDGLNALLGVRLVF